MTERVTIAEARELGYLDKTGALSKRKSAVADAKVANAEVDRQKARWKLLQRILELGHDVRIEHRFHPTRRWRFDIALLDVKVALEIDGGGWVGGAHHRAKGRENDNEKDAAAMELGWRVVRFSWDHVKNGQALATIRSIVRSMQGEIE